MEESAAAELLLLLAEDALTAIIVEPKEEDGKDVIKSEKQQTQPVLPQRKKCRKKARLTMRKGARKRHHSAILAPLPVGTICDTIWPGNGLYYECRIVDFMQINNGPIYYDVEFTDDHTKLEMLDAMCLYPIKMSVTETTTKQSRRK